ncbi:MAG: hypothetical protein IPK22_23085 [Verrucomicrobiaceae bacterium]|nr:hypothetical protein [Verrucomicrobiaceae bacterium]
MTTKRIINWHQLLPVFAAFITSCATQPVSHEAPQQAAPNRNIVSNASSAGNPANVKPFNPTPPPRAQSQQSNVDFNATAFESGGSAPGIRAQYEASAAAYRQAAAQSPSPQREQYLEAARKLDQQAAALGN